MVQKKQAETVREYKSRLFVMIFQDKEKLLELYNAVSGKQYENPELLTINTLDNAIYLSMKNDLSFLIGSQLSLYEHQSTKNILRDFLEKNRAEEELKRLRAEMGLCNNTGYVRR